MGWEVEDFISESQTKGLWDEGRQAAPGCAGAAAAGVCSCGGVCFESGGLRAADGSGRIAKGLASVFRLWAPVHLGWRTHQGRSRRKCSPKAAGPS